MEDSRSRSPRRKHRSRKSHSRSRSRRDAHRRSSSKDDKHKHKKTERVYESPFLIADICYSSILAGPALCKVIKKELPKLNDIDECKNAKKRNGVADGNFSFISAQAEETCRMILSRLEAKLS